MLRELAELKSDRSGGENPANTEISVLSGACPSRRVLDLIADKWTMLILPALHSGPKRNSEILRTVDGIPQKMLTQTLRNLERNGFFERWDYGEVPPRVDYTLTALGRSLAEPLWVLDRWVETHFHEIEAARVAFDKTAEAA